MSSRRDSRASDDFSNRLTEGVRQAPGVSDALVPYAIRTSDARLKGIEQTTRVIVGDLQRSNITRVA
jgi:hypothetical protein